MSRILILAHGAHTCAREALPGTKAIVASGTLDADILAKTFEVPLLAADEVFRTNNETARYSATRLGVSAWGFGVYSPLHEEWVERAHWARGNSSALITGYLLARAHLADEIQFRKASRHEKVMVSPWILRKLDEFRIGLKYLN